MQIGSGSKVIVRRNDEDIELMEQVKNIVSIDESDKQENVKFGCF